MADLAPLETLYDAGSGDVIPLPSELAAVYGHLRFPSHPNRPTVISNFVATLDGVVSLNVPGHAGGGDISGFNQHDRLVMGLLRAAADVVIVGTGGLRIGPDHLWTAEYIYPALAGAYQSLRDSLGKAGPPLHVIVTTSGEVDAGLRVFQSGEVPVLIATTAGGARQIHARGMPAAVGVVVLQSSGLLGAQAILDAVGRAHPARQGDVLLVEGGPRLAGTFFAERRLDELFLTLAPQVAGRDGSLERPGFVRGHIFAPEHPRWGTLVGIKRGGSHLFLRYSFESAL
jgi:riboflavin biosynthesis pyrimidine reductase